MLTLRDKKGRFIGDRYKKIDGVWFKGKCEKCGKLVTGNKVKRCLECRKEIQRSLMIGKVGLLSPRWKNGIRSYHKNKKNYCENCGSISSLLVHHKDGNRLNNNLSNLMTCCSRCHQGVFHKKSHVKNWRNQYAKSK